MSSAPAVLSAPRGVRDGARRVHDVVDEQHVAALHLADDVDDLGHVLRRAALVDDREVGAEALGVAAGGLDGARRRGRRPRGCRSACRLARCSTKTRRGVEVVDRHVEEALDLRRVQVHRQHAVDARRGEQVGHELGRDGHARLVLALLPGVAEVRHHRRDARRAGPPGRVDEQEQLDPVLRRGARRLDEVEVGSADGLVEADVELAVGEVLDMTLPEPSARRSAR